MPVHFDLARRAVAALEQVLGFRGRLPLRAHVEQVHEEVVGERPGTIGEHAVPRPSGVRAQDAHAADEHRHLGCGQRQELRPIDQQRLCRRGLAGRHVVAEPVGAGLEHGERLDVGLLLRGIRAPGREWHLDVVPGVLRGLLDRRAPAQDDQVGERDPLPAGLRAVEVRLDPLQRLQHLRQLGRVVRPPSPSAGRGGCARRWPRRAGRCHGTTPPMPRRSRPAGRRTARTRGSCAFRAAMSWSPISSWSTAGTGSCQISGSAGTSGPRYRERGPMSRCVSLNHARAKASANSSGCS